MYFLLIMWAQTLNHSSSFKTGDDTSLNQLHCVIEDNWNVKCHKTTFAIICLSRHDHSYKGNIFRSNIPCEMTRKECNNEINQNTWWCILQIWYLFFCAIENKRCASIDILSWQEFCVLENHILRYKMSSMRLTNSIKR